MGRRCMFPGKNRVMHNTAYLTDEGWDITQKLREYFEPKIGFMPSIGDVFEEAVRARIKQIELK